jgi:hypothetical protein
VKFRHWKLGEYPAIIIGVYIHSIILGICTFWKQYRFYKIPYNTIYMYAPLLTDLFSNSYEAEFVQKLLEMKTKN